MAQQCNLQKVWKILLWISCLLLWVGNPNFKFRIVIWNILFGDRTFWKKATFSKATGMESAQSYFLVWFTSFLIWNDFNFSRMEKTIVGRKQTLKEDRHYAAKMIECSKEASATHKRDITETFQFSSNLIKIKLQIFPPFKVNNQVLTGIYQCWASQYWCISMTSDDGVKTRNKLKCCLSERKTQLPYFLI